MMGKSIAVFGGSRRHGNTGKLVDWIAAQLEFEVIDLADRDISPYDYEHNNINDDFIPLMEQVLQYDKIIFCNPGLLVWP